MKKKILILASVCMFALFMALSVTTSETDSNLSLCGEVALAGSLNCADAPCAVTGTSSCSGCPVGCTCRWNVTDPGEGG